MSRPSMLPGRITSTFPFDSLLHFGNNLAHRPALQQIRSRSLLSANRAAEFGHNESRFQGFAEGPPRRFAPLSRQSHVSALDFQNVARDFDAHALPRQRFRQIGPSRFAAGIEAHERSQQPHGVERFRTRTLTREPIAYSPRIQ